MNRKLNLVVVLIFVSMLLCARQLAAQAGGSWLKGQVTDPSGAVVVQAGRREMGPLLPRTIDRNRADREPVALCQRHNLARFNLGRKARQCQHRSSQECENSEGCEGFDHVDLLTGLSRSLTFGDRINNNQNAKSFQGRNSW